MSTPQPIAPSATAILLDGIIGALIDRGPLAPAERQIRANDVRALIDSFQPSDPLQVMLIGQAVLFHDLVADGAHDVLRGMKDTLKLRAQSNVNALNRSLHQNLGMFLRMRDKAAPARREDALIPDEVPNTPPQPEPVEQVSWLDEPYTTWVIETPAAAARAQTESAALAELPPIDAPPEDDAEEIAAAIAAERRHGRSGVPPLVERAAMGADQSRVPELAETS